MGKDTSSVKIISDIHGLHEGIALSAGKYQIVAKTWEVLACVCIPGVTFAFDKSFIRPQVVDQIKKLEAAFLEHPLARVFVFGHTDKVGSDSYNKELSERRAHSALAFITNDTDVWEDLYNKENWGLRPIQEMLIDLGYKPGLADGEDGPKTQAAVKEFQKSWSLSESGHADKETRKLLFSEYMSGKHDIKIDAEQFLEPKYMGCGEFNPVVNTEEKFEPNRRVSFFLFHPEKFPQIPCKLGDMSPCKKLMEPKTPRHQDSFQCLFFDNLAHGCGCEGEVKSNKFTLTGSLFYNRIWDYNTAPKLPKTEVIAAIEELLPGAYCELYLENQPSGKFILHSTTFLSDDGEFEFKEINAITKTRLRIHLKYRDNSVVLVQGLSNTLKDSDFHIQLNEVVWYEFDLDTSKWSKENPNLDLGKTEIKKDHFIDICDAYKTVWFGHKRMKELVEYDLPLCKINYPEPEKSVSNASKTMQLLKLDLKDRDVILHEYGHFIGFHALGGLGSAGYLYNDEPGHGPTTEEHYESAWDEGHATFLSCALSDDPHYHDGYDAFLDMYLDTDNTTTGPHCEGSIQEALWHILKINNLLLKDGFWPAFTYNLRKPHTIFDFYNNWKDLKLNGLSKIAETFKKFNIECGYEYLDGSRKFTATKDLKNIDVSKKQFFTIDQLFDAFGKNDAGVLIKYKEEFYNRNKYFNSGSLGKGSTITDPKIVIGSSYIIPKRFKISI